jgi:hypothetical protein
MDLTALLDQGAAFDAEYRGGLSNHRPMALLALARLGASPQRLAAFARHYEARLEPAPPWQAWPAGDAWKPRLGQRQAWPLYRDLFWHWLLTEDAGEVLRQALPPLMQGCGGAAFHGLIRTACAVQAAHRRELADALAYWACRWLDLGFSSHTGGQDDPEVVLRQLRASRSDADLIFERMQVAARDAHFQATVAQLRVAEHTLQRLARLAAQAYAASGNFTALHLVTSAHAVRILWPYLEDPLAAMQAYWRAYAAAVCASGMQAGTAPPPRPWPELVAAALASDDEHVIKLVVSCREQRQFYGDAGPWQQAATRAI